MVLTQEMEGWVLDFDKFLSEIDRKHANYFNSGEIDAKSIRDCLTIKNGANITFVIPSLNPDIYNEVLNKHKEIWGEWHSLGTA